MLEPSLTTTAPISLKELRERSAAERIARDAPARPRHRRLAARRRLRLGMPRARLRDQHQHLTQQVRAAVRRRGVLTAPGALDASRDRRRERVAREAVVDVLCAEDATLEPDVGATGLGSVAGEVIVRDAVA